MKTNPDRWTPALNRRQFLAAGGGLIFGAAGFGVVPRLAGALQIDATPPAPPVIAPTVSAGETAADVAARLDYDIEAIFAFVRDEIHYESYAGVLRGAKGTLWARAGNSADQAVLLGEILHAAQIPHRFATGPLDPAQADALTARLNLTNEESLKAHDAAELAAYLNLTGLTEIPETIPEPSAEEQAVSDKFRSSSERALEIAVASAEMSRSAITDSLASASVELPALPPPVLADRELNRHVWIQVSDGPAWIDYDPSLPGDGTTAPASAVETSASLPEDWYHLIRIGIVAEEYVGGTLSRREAVSFSTRSEDVVDVPIAFSMASANELSGLGLSINERFTGQKTIYPTIYVDGVTTDASQPLIFATDASSTQDVLGSGEPVVGAGDGETVAVWLVVDLTSPDAAPLTVERALLDRLPAEDRASGMIVPENITPIQTVPTNLGDETLEQFNVLTILHTDVARMPLLDMFTRYGRDEIYGAIGMMGPTLAGLRDLLGMREEAAIGYWSYPSAPNLTVFHFEPPSEGSGTQARVSVDLLHRHRTSLPLAGNAPSGTVHPLVLSGVLDAVAERMLLAPETRGEAPGDYSGFATGPSAGGVFEAAAEAGLEVRILTSTADLGQVEADAASQGYMAAALEAGLYVVVPEQPIERDGEPVLGWWIVDPATGRTTDQLYNGMSNASTAFTARRLAALQASGEYSFVTRAIAWFVANSRAFLCLGVGVAFGALFTLALLEAARGEGTGDTALAAAAGAAASAGGTAGTMAAC